MLVAPLLALIVLLASAAVAEATTFTVNTFSDSSDQNSCQVAGPAPTTCSLRDAVGDAADGDTIQLPSGSYSVTLGTIGISHSITITGTTSIPSDTTISGSGNSTQNGSSGRIFKVGSGSVTIQDLTLANGNDSNDENCCGGSATNLLGGGALYNAPGATVGLTNVRLTNDSTFGIGGGVSNAGTLGLTNVEFKADDAALGGGLFSHSGTVTGTNVTFANDATGATSDAAMYLAGGSASFTNTTVAGSGGASSIGGGIRNAGAQLQLEFATLNGNTRGSLETDSGTTTVADTIIDSCVPAGQPPSQPVSSNPISTDNGHNLDGDNSCGLSAANHNDIPGASLNLAPIFNNGGPTDTEALLAGSQAIGGGSLTDCASVGNDQRGQSRDQSHCDIGAFEAVTRGNPTTATTQQASNVSDTTATLNGTINLDGEAGGFHFVYSTDPSLANATHSPEVAAGVVTADAPEFEQVSGLSPNTKYYYAIVADNASGSKPDSTTPPTSFTTAPGAPSITNTQVTNVTDTTASIQFTVADNGADTTYHVQYGPDSTYGTTTPDQQLSAGSGPKQVVVVLSNLNPNSLYHFNVHASNSVGSADSGDQTLTTAQQIRGTVGSPVQASYSSSVDGSCPQNPPTSIDWGDGANDPGQFQCSNGNFTVSGTHTYGSPNDYKVQISFQNSVALVEYALISPAPQPTVTSVSPIQGPAAGGNQVTVHGTNLTGATAVNFGQGNAVTNPAVSADGSQLTVTAPPGSGTVDVTVTTPGGTSPVNAPNDQYTFVAAPSVAGVSPKQGPTSAGTPVTITGTNLQGASAVDFGQNNPATNVQVNQAGTQITAKAPAGSGTVDVTVTTPGGTSPVNAPNDQYTFVSPPNVTSIAPTSGPAGGGTRVTINGTNLSGATVQFGGQAATIVGSSGDTQLVALSPAGSGTVDVTVTTPGGTSATGPADKYTYTPVTPPPPTGRPKVATFTPLLSGKHGAQLTGEVNPQGLPTTAYYVYGLDARYQQFGITVYDHSTPKTLFGSDFNNHQLPATLTGLVPNAVYHVRMVALNNDGQTIGPDQTFNTPRTAAPPAPTVGHENVKPSGGTVFVLQNGNLVPLTQNTRLPSGAEIDALHGSISLVAASGTKGKASTGTFGGAIFTLTQTTFGPNKGLITLAIVESAFPGAPTYASCSSNTARAAGAHIALSSRVLQSLRSRSRGRFRTRGRYAAGTVRGTQWTTSDRCDGTLIAVQVHAVQVTDLVKHITLLVHAGHQYLALAHPPKTKHKKKHK